MGCTPTLLELPAYLPRGQPKVILRRRVECVLRSKNPRLQRSEVIDPAELIILLSQMQIVAFGAGKSIFGAERNIQNDKCRLDGGEGGIQAK